MNLLLVLGLGIVLGVAATDASKDANGSAPVPAATTIASQACRRAASP